MSAAIKPNNIARFKQKVRNYYRAAGRHDLPWRKRTTPYRILVSEIMLQQTQVARVIEKFNAFMKLYPNASALAEASLTEVLRAWQGLGYNRRAKYLHSTAQLIAVNFKGKFPREIEQLKKLPGIGVNTAGAIVSYAYNQPVVFIETNIRRTFIHEFFPDKDAVADSEILPFVADAVRREKNPREWYWALMDYGSMLGRTAKLANPNRRSKHYAVQSKFEGSRRQVRGKILKLLLNNDKPCSASMLAGFVGSVSIDINSVLGDLIKENLVIKMGKRFKIR